RHGASGLPVFSGATRRASPGTSTPSKVVDPLTTTRHTRTSATTIAITRPALPVTRPCAADVIASRTFRLMSHAGNYHPSISANQLHVEIETLLHLTTVPPADPHRDFTLGDG